MQISDFDRQKIVSRLVEDAIDSVKQSPSYARDVFFNGTVGFNKMVNEDLVRAYVDAGLNDHFSNDINLPEDI